MMMFMGLHVVIEPKPVPNILRHGPRAIVVTCEEAVKLASGDRGAIIALMAEREAYETAKAS